MNSNTPLITVGLGLWQDRPADEALATARAADDLSFTELWIGEMATYDAFALAAVVGQQTQQIRLTIGPLAVSVRDPMMLAVGIASVADLTTRPVNLAVGTSSPLVVERWHGRARHRPLRAMREAIAELRLLLEGQAGQHAGTIVGSSGYKLRLPAPRSTITVAGFGPKALELGAEQGDRIVLSLVTADAAGQLTDHVREHLATDSERERPPVAVWVPTAVDGGDKARDQVRSMLVGYLGAPGYSEMFEQAGFEDLVAFARSRPHPREILQRIPDELVERVSAIGTADEVRARLAEYGKHCEEVVILPASTDEDPSGVHTLQSLAPHGRKADND